MPVQFVSLLDIFPEEEVSGPFRITRVIWGPGLESFVRTISVPVPSGVLGIVRLESGRERERPLRRIVQAEGLVEQALQLAFIERARGNVLVSGLGLGLGIAALLAKHADRETLGSLRITVLEKFGDVIRLVEPRLRAWMTSRGIPQDRLEILHKNVYRWTIRTGGRPFDSFWMDHYVSPSNDFIANDAGALRERYAPILAPGAWVATPYDAASALTTLPALSRGERFRP